MNKRNSSLCSVPELWSWDFQKSLKGIICELNAFDLESLRYTKYRTPVSFYCHFAAQNPTSMYCISHLQYLSPTAVLVISFIGLDLLFIIHIEQLFVYIIRNGKKVIQSQSWYFQLKIVTMLLIFISQRRKGAHILSVPALISGSGHKVVLCS